MYKRTVKVLLILALCTLAFSSAFAQSATQAIKVFLPTVTKLQTDTLYTGDGTYYDANGTGNCSFDAAPDRMVAAMNTTDYADSAICGAFVEITGPKGVVTVRITDRCPECKPGDIDLSREAFALIANPVDGRVTIRWHVVSPNLSGPIIYHFKEGSNQWWTAVQIRNHRNPIAKVEYQTPGGDFKTVGRVSYNYFVESSGMGVGPYTFRVTDIYGNSVTDSGIVFREAGDVSGAQQFPAKP